MKSCLACRTELPDYAHVCEHCGRAFDTTTTIDKAPTRSYPATVNVRPLDGSTANSHISTILHKVLRRLPMPAQHVIAALLTRAQDPNAELTYMQQAARSHTIVLGWLPKLVMTNMVGLFSVAYAYTAARRGATGADIFFWLGLLIIFVPAIVRLISPATSRFERISLLCVVGISFYLVRVMYSPLNFSGYDEFLHWRTADDIARSTHLFSTNALLPVSPDYPGLEIVTNELSRLSGLSIFHSGIIVIGVARLVMILSLFMLNEQILNSARIAGIATIIYMTNPHFLTFDAQFAYESLALPLALFMMSVMAYHEVLKGRLRWLGLAAWITLAAVVVTHHVTDFIFDGFLVLWAVLYTFLHRTFILQSRVAKIALFGVFITVAYVFLIARPVMEYLSSFFSSALGELVQVATQSRSARQLFVAYGGQPAPPWERAVALSSIALILLCLPFGLLCLWQRYRRNVLAYMLGIVSLLYPVSQVFRFTVSGGEISDRFTSFVFISISFVLAIFITQFWPTRWLNLKQTSLITCALSVVFLGGVIVGVGPPWAILPGSYLVSADQRSIDPEGIQAAQWAHSDLGPNNRIGTDRINSILMGTYGDERIVTGVVDNNVDLSPVFLSSRLGPSDLTVLRRAQVRYLVVDLRFAYGLPQLGYYYQPYEFDAYHRIAPVDLAALTKFDTIPQINRVFDSGDIVIYDIGGLINAPEKP